MQTARTPERHHAIVIGGSMAGLLAARVLSGHYAEVTIVERDASPQAPVHRRGVPQGRHTHGLLAGGVHGLEQLFPGISGELAAEGALIGDVVRDCRWFMEGGCLDRPASGLQALFLSRPMLESAVRRRTLALPNVRLRQQTIVTSLITGSGLQRVTGVRVGDGRDVRDGPAGAALRGEHRRGNDPVLVGRLGEERADAAACSVDPVARCRGAPRRDFT
jgi:2-polyprenyl-6-methoxyphenol hydroxylase-like FAD-dependent oxidoreductase